MLANNYFDENFAAEAYGSVPDGSNRKQKSNFLQTVNNSTKNPLQNNSFQQVSLGQRYHQEESKFEQSNNNFGEEPKVLSSGAAIRPIYNTIK